MKIKKISKNENGEFVVKVQLTLEFVIEDQIEKDEIDKAFMIEYIDNFSRLELGEMVLEVLEEE